MTAVAQGIARVLAPFRATTKQRELARHWNDPDAKIVLVGGAIRSGKTQAAGRLIVETAVEQPATYLVARSTYRELEDSTKKALLYGDGSMSPLIPPELIASYRASDNVVKLRTGAEILFRSLEEAQIGKVMNLTLGGVFIDQIEELDGGEPGERILDTLLGRLSDARGPRKLLAVANPSGLTHWVYRRLVDPETRDRNARYVHVTLRDNAAHLPADYVREMYATKKTRPAWYRSYVLGEWGAFEGAAFNEFEDDIHVIAPFEQIPEGWGVFQSLDHGFNHPTAVLTWLADGDGNFIVAEEYLSPGLVSKHAAHLLKDQQDFGETLEIFADPSVFASQGLQDRPGTPASVASEYANQGITLTPANNDPVAGYGRLLELLHVDPDRIAPPFARIRAGAGGAPRLYIFKTCSELIQQLKSAPVASDGTDPGEAVDRHWESEHGHCVASLRYGALAQAGYNSLEQRQRRAEVGAYYDRETRKRPPRDGPQHHEDALLMNLRRRKKPELPTKPAESARLPDPEPQPIHPLSFAAWKRQHGGRPPRVPVLPPDSAEAQLAADHARRQAEQKAESARIKAELAAEQARREAESDAAHERFMAESLWLQPENGHRDPRSVKF